MSQFTQDFIYRWQHPTDCSLREVVTSKAVPSGMGSEIHVIGPNQYHSRSIVATCDDPHDIDLLKDGIRNLGHGWSLFFSDIPRPDQGFQFGQVSHVQGKWEWTTSHIAQLFLALESDGFIGTRASNWNRLIDELRCVWVNKCSAVYVEVGTIKGYEW
jgi:hypothetical protein